MSFVLITRKEGLVVQGIFAKIGPDLELRGPGDLISSPVDSIVSLVSPKIVPDPTQWGKLFFGHALFQF